MEKYELFSFLLMILLVILWFYGCTVVHCCKVFLNNACGYKIQKLFVFLILVTFLYFSKDLRMI